MAGEGGGEEKTIAAGAGDTEEKSGEETTAEPPKLPKKQACKRPAEDRQLQSAAAAKKRAHHSNLQHVGAPAPPPQGNGMQAPFRAPEYYARPPMPRPPVAHNNGQAPRPPLNGQVRGPRQPAAYNGQVPMMARQPAAYNGQMPVAHQQVAFNGQVRPPQYRTVGAPNNHGQNQTVMTRPSCPAGQAVNPPSAVPRMPKQPETDEMREKRVIRQNLEEYLRLKREICAAKQQQQQWRMTFTQEQQQQAMTFTQQQAQAMAFMQQQQQQAQAMAFTQQQQQAQPMPFTQQQQQAMAFTQQQQQLAQAMAVTQQQATAYAPQLQQYRQQQQQQYHQQQPYLGGANANYHHQAGAMAPRFSLDDFYASNAAQHYERSRVVLPATSGPLGEAARVTAEGSAVSTVVRVEGNGDRGSHDQQEPVAMGVPSGGSAPAEGDGTEHA